MVKVVIGKSFIAEIRVQTKGRPMVFVVDYVELDYFSPITSVFLIRVLLPMLHNRLTLTLYRPRNWQRRYTCFITCDCNKNQWKNVV